MKKHLIGYALAIILSSVATFVVTAPATLADRAQTAILHEYLSAYCQRDTKHSVDWSMGVTALLSRLTIKAGIGELALAEFAKCKVWVNGTSRL